MLYGHQIEDRKKHPIEPVHLNIHHMPQYKDFIMLLFKITQDAMSQSLYIYAAFNQEFADINFYS